MTVNENLGASAGRPGSREPDPKRVPAASGFDPSREGYSDALEALRLGARILWRQVQAAERCDLAECVFKFDGNCHCMGTFLGIVQGTIIGACDSDGSREAGETALAGSTRSATARAGTASPNTNQDPPHDQQD